MVLQCEFSVCFLKVSSTYSVIKDLSILLWWVVIIWFIIAIIRLHNSSNRLIIGTLLIRNVIWLHRLYVILLLTSVISYYWFVGDILGNTITKFITLLNHRVFLVFLIFALMNIHLVDTSTLESTSALLSIGIRDFFLFFNDLCLTREIAGIFLFSDELNRLARYVAYLLKGNTETEDIAHDCELLFNIFALLNVLH